MKENVNKQKCKLIEKLGVHLESKDQLAPVAARVFAYIVLKGKAGTSFDELVENLCASKSTISTHLTHLQSLDKIKYFTKIGDRKKYFVMNPTVMVKGIDRLIEDMSTEKEIHSEVKKYKEYVNTLDETTEDLKFDVEFHEDLIEFLDRTITSVTEIRNKIIKKHK